MDRGAQSLPAYNRRLGSLRVLATFALLASLLWIARPARTMLAAGLPLVVLGECVRFWAAGHLCKTVELITSGPYRYTRNPLYLGRLLIFCGLCVMATLPYQANWIVLALGLFVFFGYYLPRKERIEPARLRREHGAAYERYFRAVPALIPALRPYGQDVGGAWRSERMLRNREHWMILGLLTAVTWLYLRTPG